MTKYTLAILSLLVVLSLSTLTSTVTLPVDISLCKPIQQCATPSGCWTACTSSQFNNCGDVFPAIYDPKFCAYTKDGRYISYTFSCQACQNTDVIAVRDGACTCDFIKCQDNQQCQNGQCIDLHPIDPINLCAAVTCPINSICQDGKCIQQVKPCKKLCILGYECVNGQCVPSKPVDLCATVRCSVGYTCVKGQCVCNILSKSCLNVQCREGQTCRNGFCVRNLLLIDPCSFIRCRQGYNCKNGTCVAQPGLCGVVVCSPEFECRNGQCVDPNIDWACAAIRCNSAQGYYCKNGTCIRDCNAIKVNCPLIRPNQKTCPTLYYIVAPQLNICGVTASGVQTSYARQCQACKDTSVQYYWNKKCEDLIGCEKPQCQCDQDCQNGFSCEFGSCINRCLYAKCALGYHCVKGDCIKDVEQTNNTDVDWACAAIRCNSAQGYFCKNGSCIRDCNAIKVNCPLVRPNQKTCPTLYYFVKPEPTVCGISSNGVQTGFPRQCDACKDISVQYYWTKRCQDLVGCQKPKCTCDGDCQIGLSCEAGACVNKCITVKCSAGFHCYKGACVKDAFVYLDANHL